MSGGSPDFSHQQYEGFCQIHVIQRIEASKSINRATSIAGDHKLSILEVGRHLQCDTRYFIFQTVASINKRP